MRIKITENQYRGILNENRLENFINSIIDEWKDKVKAIVPTHAHLDHIGAIPFLGNLYDAQ